MHKHLLQMICVLNRREGAVLFFFFSSPKSRLLSGIEKERIKLKSLLSIIGVEWEENIDINSLRSKGRCWNLPYEDLQSLPLIYQYYPILILKRGMEIFSAKEELINWNIFRQKKNIVFSFQRSKISFEPLIFLTPCLKEAGVHASEKDFCPCSEENEDFFF